jgi:hypothetical protein
VRENTGGMTTDNSTCLPAASLFILLSGIILTDISGSRLIAEFKQTCKQRLFGRKIGSGQLRQANEAQFSANRELQESSEKS